jgi:hypothetical protein
MKNILTIIFIGIIGICLASDGKYQKVMSKNIAQLYEAKSVEDYQKVINALDRIALAEEGKWEPHYYGAFGNIMMSTKVQTIAEKDQHLDAAQSRLDKAAALQAQNVEVITLQGFIHMMRLSVDPASRGQQYAGIAFASFNKAVAMDSLNPRALIMRAQMKQGTAKFFGTSTDEACGEAAKALAIFDEQDKAVASIAPKWGRGSAESMMKQCSQLNE